MAKAKIIEEYSAQYCQELEIAYGHGLMSESGPAEIELMFGQNKPKGIKALDFGSGLGRVAFYLAHKYATRITGLETNPSLVEEANQRVPAGMEVSFILHDDVTKLPFADAEFAMVYSKGTLMHVPHKDRLFKEFSRILKPGGRLVINDWLSPSDNSWGEIITKMANADGLTIFPWTKARYIRTLQNAGFSNIALRDDSSRYCQFNHDLITSLNDQETQEAFVSRFGKADYETAINGYSSIADAIACKELLVTNFEAVKN
jgi:ubiquinone/menaquinone biosynthesis C-methylase UbiE